MAMTTAILEQWASGLRSLEPADDPAFGLATEDRAGQAYNQAAFRYFFRLERQRAERAGRPFALLLIDLGEPKESPRRFDPKAASRLFEALRSVLRDTDVIGWHQQGHVVGALLTSEAGATAPDIERVIGERVGHAIRESLSDERYPRIEVRVFAAPASVATPQPAAAQPWQ
jgi:GGDEF domain-containing protein